MKASVCKKYGNADIIEIKDILKPAPKENEILVSVKYALVTPSDCSFRTGTPYIARLFSGLFKPKNSVHGEMYAGVVEGLGENVKDYEIGDRVYGSNGMKLGSYAEYNCVKDNTLIRKVPNELSLEQVITLLDGGITALPFLRDTGEIQPNQRILIIGASGSVGSNAVQLAKHFKAHVTGVCSTENINTVKSLGCDEVIDYKKTDYEAQKIKYDIIFDAVAKSSFKSCKSILTENGRYMTTVPTLSLMLKAVCKKKRIGKKALFAATGLRKPHEKNKDLEYLEELLKLKVLTPLMDNIYPLDEMVMAQKRVETGHKTGNVLVKN